MYQQLDEDDDDSGQDGTAKNRGEGQYPVGQRESIEQIESTMQDEHDQEGVEDVVPEAQCEERRLEIVGGIAWGEHFENEGLHHSNQGAGCRCHAGGVAEDVEKKTCDESPCQHADA